MCEIGVIGFSLYSSNDFLEENKESYRENQGEKTESAFRDSLGSLFGQEYSPWIVRSFKGREVEHLQTSSLLGFNEKLSELSQEPNFGVHYHGFGKGLVKGSNLAFRTTVVGQNEMTELDFKVNHVFRTNIQHVIDDLSQRDLDVMTSILSLTGSHGKRVLLEREQRLPLGNSNMGSAVKVSLEGLGSIFIGSTPGLPGMYDRVVVQMGTDKSIYDLHELLAFFDLDSCLHQSSKEDMERLKIGHLFRTFYPREALSLERSEEFFRLSIDQLKIKVEEEVPEMRDIFDAYLEQMTPGEILPGRLRYRINGLAKKACEIGARGLTAAITGAYSNEEGYNQVGSILTLGLLSTEMRRKIGSSVSGMSSSSDFYSGGADSVFTQMITEKNCRNKLVFSDLYYHSDIRLLISLDALEMGSYQYFGDGFGNRLVDSSNYWGCEYVSRPGILEFIDKIQKGSVRFASGLSPELIARIEKVLKMIEAYLIGTEDSDDIREIVYGMDREELLEILENGREFLNRVREGRSDFRFFVEESYLSHEVMFKERLDPSLIEKIVVSSSEVQSGLIRYLEGCHLVESDPEQRKWILGKPLDQFIVVADHASEDLFKNCHAL